MTIGFLIAIMALVVATLIICRLAKANPAPAVILEVIVGLLLLVLMLGGCGHTQDRPPAAVVTQEVKIAVPVPCDPKMSARPDWPDTAAALKTADDALQRQLLYAGRTARNGYIVELEAALKACMNAAKP